MSSENRKLIDNKSYTLHEAIELHSKGFEELSIATGYIDLKVFQSLKPVISEMKKVRIIIGMEPQLRRYMLKNPLEDFPDKDLITDLNEEIFTSEYSDIVSMLKRMIDDKSLEIKILKKNFLHAKCYIFGNYSSDNAVGIIGSSNFTNNGLSKNIELNYVENNPMNVKYKPNNVNDQKGHMAWFEEMWNDDDLEEWSFDFLNIVQASPVGNLLFSPYESYIKTIFEIFNHEAKISLSNEQTNKDNFQESTKLFRFQKENTQMLIDKMRKNKVALLSDSVGLGKTLTAINVIRHYINSTDTKVRVEVICPASLTDHWKKELVNEKIINISVTSKMNFNEISQRQQLDKIADVTLFVIDESHNYRNINSESYKILSNWIKNNPKSHVLLLTATPINNNLIDINNQLLLGTGGDVERFFVNFFDENQTSKFLNWSDYIKRIQSDITKQINETGSFDNEKLKNDISPIVREFVVRRTRQGIKKRYGNLSFNGKEKSFPEVNSELCEYETEYTKYELKNIQNLKTPLKEYFKFDPEQVIDATKKILLHPIEVLNYKKIDKTVEDYQHPIQNIFHLILLLGLTPYKWRMYKKDIYGKDREKIGLSIVDLDEKKKLQTQLSFYGIFRSLFLKRVESSLHSFKLSLERYLKILEIFEKGLKKNLFLNTKAVEIILSIQDYDSEKEIDDQLLNKLGEFGNDFFEPFVEKEYEVEKIKSDIENDLEICRTIISLVEELEKNDSKLKRLLSQIEHIISDNPKRKILIFSYFEDTLNYLKNNIYQNTQLFSEDNTEFISSKNSKNKENILDRFSPESRNAKDIKQPIQYLFSTDVLSEGQSLQDCNYIINYDLHWNPVRMIQRNGRINRLGSKFDEVNIINFKPEAKLDKYLKLISKLEGKIDLIKNTIGTDSSVLVEPAQPIDFIDLIETIYNVDKDIRKKYLNLIEEKQDLLISEDTYVDDLLEFIENNESNYKEQIFSISENKWHLYLGIQNNDEARVLVKTYDSNNTDYEIFRVFKYLDGTLVEEELNLFLKQLRDSNFHIRERLKDNLSINRTMVKSLLEERLQSENSSQKKQKLFKQDKEFLEYIHPDYGKIKVLSDEFKMIMDALQTTNKLDIKEYRKFRSEALKSKEDNKKFEIILDEFLSKIKTNNRNEQRSIKYDKTEALCLFSNSKK